MLSGKACFNFDKNNFMSGHSKWATIKRAKAVTDGKKAAIFTKLGNLITIAVKEKGSDPETNFSLRMAMEKAKSANLPKDNIERAIKRGTGELMGEQIEELYYEGFGPAKSQFIVKSLTDNKNRSAANIRHIFTKYGGSLGSVMWNFSQKGVIRISKEELDNKNIKFENIELDLIDKGADDILHEDEGISIFTKLEDLVELKKYFDNKQIETVSAEIEYIANEEQPASEEEKEKIKNVIEALDECEDVSNYYVNVVI